jgi:hypothetical protein
VGAHLRDRRRDPALALVEVHRGPGVVLGVRVLDRRDRLVVADPRRALDRLAVDRVDVVARLAAALPLAAVQVEDPVRVERLRRRRPCLRVDRVPLRARLQLQRHDAPLLVRLGGPSMDHRGGGTRAGLRTARW